MARYTPTQYRNWGREVILQILRARYAAVWPEIEARGAEREHEPAPLPIDTNHLREAYFELTAAGQVVQETRGPTRGGRTVDIIRPTDLTGIRTATTKAAARKSLLYARYLSWASGSPAQPGIIGPAGEQIVHASLRDAAPIVGHQIPNPDTGQTTSVADVPVPLGPLDNAAIFVDFATGERFALLIEVKNVRDWVWPAGDELPQLLTKAALMTPELHAHGYLPIPVLVCRRAHKTTLRLAKDLGLHIIDTRRQFLPPSAFSTETAHRHLTEVRAELGFADLLPHTGPYPIVVKHFATVIPKRASEAAHRWLTHGADFTATYEALRASSTTAQRARLLSPLRHDPASTGGW